MDTWVWVVIAIVVIAIVVGLILWSQRRNNTQERIEKAQHLRAEGQQADLHAKEQAAAAAREQAEAQRARMEAERLERTAQERAVEAERAQQAAQSRLEEANRLLPEGADLDADRGLDPRAGDARRVADPTDDRFDRRDQVGDPTVRDSTVRDADLSDPNPRDDRRL